MSVHLCRQKISDSDIKLPPKRIQMFLNATKVAIIFIKVQILFSAQQNHKTKFTLFISILSFYNVMQKSFSSLNANFSMYINRQTLTVLSFAQLISSFFTYPLLHNQLKTIFSAHSDFRVKILWLNWNVCLEKVRHLSKEHKIFLFEMNAIPSSMLLSLTGVVYGIEKENLFIKIVILIEF